MEKVNDCVDPNWCFENPHRAAEEIERLQGEVNRLEYAARKWAEDGHLKRVIAGAQAEALERVSSRNYYVDSATDMRADIDREASELRRQAEGDES